MANRVRTNKVIRMVKKNTEFKPVASKCEHVRPMEDLLEIMLRYIKKNKRAHFTGLCGLASNMLFLEYISYKELKVLCVYIKQNAKPHKTRLLIMTILSILHAPNKSYYWPKGLMWPRIIWLKKQIRQIRKQENS